MLSYACDLCRRSFASGMALQQHMSVKHAHTDAAVPKTAEKSIQNPLKYSEIVAAAPEKTPSIASSSSLRDLVTPNPQTRLLSTLNGISVTLADEAAVKDHQDVAYFADLVQEGEESKSVYLNVREPFCVVMCGNQGSGKSHSLTVITESCLLRTNELKDEHDRSLLRLTRPMCALVFHFDVNEGSICEVTGIITPAFKFMGRLAPHLPREKLAVMVSPTFYLQRKAFYGDYCAVYPMLFRWSTMKASHIRLLMRVLDGDNQLYMATLLNILKTYQRNGSLPEFSAFLKEIESKANVSGQSAPLQQRLSILETFIFESAKNAGLRKGAAALPDLMKSGSLIVADMTDPMLSTDEVNSVFTLLTEIFRESPVKGDGGRTGKLLLVDEAHKFMNGQKGDSLSDALVNAARLMRHDGLRLVISTQSPLTVRPEILELTSMAVMHRFQSRDWFQHVARKVPFDASDFDRILELPLGGALVFAGRCKIGDSVGGRVVQLNVRVIEHDG